MQSGPQKSGQSVWFVEIGADGKSFLCLMTAIKEDLVLRKFMKLDRIEKEDERYTRSEVGCQFPCVN